MTIPQYKAGRLLGIVAEDCSENFISLVNPVACRKMAEALCDHIGMTKVTHVEFDVMDEADNNGVSCVIGMKESHIAIHTWPILNSIRITVDSCKEFDRSDVLKFVREVWRPKRIVHGEVSYF